MPKVMNTSVYQRFYALRKAVRFLMEGVQVSVFLVLSCLVFSTAAHAKDKKADKPPKMINGLPTIWPVTKVLIKTNLFGGQSYW